MSDNNYKVKKIVEFELLEYDGDPRGDYAICAASFRAHGDKVIFRLGDREFLLPDGLLSMQVLADLGFQTGLDK